MKVPIKDALRIKFRSQRPHLKVRYSCKFNLEEVEKGKSHAFCLANLDREVKYGFKWNPCITVNK